MFDISCSRNNLSEIYQPNPLDISSSRNYLSEIYQPYPFSIYLAWEITWARYINLIQFSIYLAQEITWARYINQIHFWYFSLEKLLKQDLSTESIFDISRSRNYLRKIYQPNPFLIYLAQEITWPRYFNQIHFWFISLDE